MTLEELRNDGELKSKLGKLFSSKEFQAAVELVKQTKLVPRPLKVQHPSLDHEKAVAWHYASMCGAQDLLDFMLGLPTLSPATPRDLTSVTDQDGFDEQNAPYRNRRP